MSERSAKTRRQPNYLRALECARKVGQLPAVPGSVGTLTVRHDGWCAIWRGGICDCQPDMGITWRATSACGGKDSEEGVVS